jgi:hypothetical protein
LLGRKAGAAPFSTLPSLVFGSEASLVKVSKAPVCLSRRSKPDGHIFDVLNLTFREAACNAGAFCKINREIGEGELHDPLAIPIENNSRKILSLSLSDTGVLRLHGPRRE